MMEKTFDWESEFTEVDAKIEVIKEMCRSFGNETADDMRLSQNGFWGVYFMLGKIQGTLDKLKGEWPVEGKETKNQLEVV